MKLVKKTYIGYIGVALIAAMFAACSEDTMDEINKDYDDPTTTPAKFTFADLETSTASRNLGDECYAYTACYTEQETGIYEQLYNIEKRNGLETSATSYNNTWENIYTTLRNAKVVIGKTDSDPLVKGAAEIMFAYNLALLTDLYGDVPYSEALNMDSTKTPKLDSQESIYKAIFNYLDNAITLLEAGPDNTLDGYDFMYGGDAAKWVKFAYGLKARYTMRLLATYPEADKATKLNNVLTYCSKSFTSADEQAAFNIYDATNQNPVFDFEWSRDDIAASKSMYNKLAERNDPRRYRVYYDPSYWSYVNPDSAYFNPAVNGVAGGAKYTYTYSVYMFSQLASTLLQSYHEILFLEAEALCRLDRSDDAAPILQDAIKAAFANTEASITAAMKAPKVVNYGGLEDISDFALTDSDAIKYYDDNVKPLFKANPLQETMIQKYIAFWGASSESVEAYNDIRRMKALNESFIKLENPNTSKFPLRFTYGTDDVSAYPNVTAAYGNGQYVYTEPVWWAGGTK